jgi:hypothetical protein
VIEATFALSLRQHLQMRFAGAHVGVVFRMRLNEALVQPHQLHDLTVLVGPTEKKILQPLAFLFWYTLMNGKGKVADRRRFEDGAKGVLAEVIDLGKNEGRQATRVDSTRQDSLQT